MSRLAWRVRRKVDIGPLVYAPTGNVLNAPRNTVADPAFGDFNLPLPEQLSPGATGAALAGQPVTQGAVDIENTPTNDRLRKLAADNPPPSQWLEGEEEELF